MNGVSEITQRYGDVEAVVSFRAKTVYLLLMSLGVAFIINMWKLRVIFGNCKLILEDSDVQTELDGVYHRLKCAILHSKYHEVEEASLGAGMLTCSYCKWGWWV